MHIAFLTTEYPHPSIKAYGGLATSIKSAAQGLVAKGARVSVFVISRPETKVFEEDGINVHFIPQKIYRFAGWYFYKKHVQRYINAQIKKEKIDAIEAPDWSGISAFMKFKCPLVIRFNGTDAYFCKLEGRPQKKKNFWLEKIALHGADHLISVSQFTADKTREIFSLKKHIEIIPNSVRIDQFRPEQQREEEDRILYFGSLIRKKGVFDLIKAFNILMERGSEAQLFLAGADVRDIQTGRSTQELMREMLSPKAKKRVHFLGKLDHDNIRNEIAKATVVTLPSHAEALPMTWIEAMAMEKAMLTSDIGWAKEVMVNEQTGYTVSPANHDEYACKLWRLLQNTEMRQKFGKAARARIIDRFSAQVIAEKNMGFYQKITDK